MKASTLNEKHIFNLTSNRMKIIEKIKKLRTFIGTEPINLNLFCELKKIKIGNSFKVIDDSGHGRNFAVRENMLQKEEILCELLQRCCKLKTPFINEKNHQTPILYHFSQFASILSQIKFNSKYLLYKKSRAKELC